MNTILYSRARTNRNHTASIIVCVWMPIHICILKCVYYIVYTIAHSTNMSWSVSTRVAIYTVNMPYTHRNQISKHSQHHFCWESSIRRRRHRRVVGAMRLQFALLIVPERARARFVGRKRKEKKFYCCHRRHRAARTDHIAWREEKIGKTNRIHDIFDAGELFVYTVRRSSMFR